MLQVLSQTVCSWFRIRFCNKVFTFSNFIFGWRRFMLSFVASVTLMEFSWKSRPSWLVPLLMASYINPGVRILAVDKTSFCNVLPRTLCMMQAKHKTRGIRILVIFGDYVFLPTCRTSIGKTGAPFACYVWSLTCHCSTGWIIKFDNAFRKRRRQDIFYVTWAGSSSELFWSLFIRRPSVRLPVFPSVCKLKLKMWNDYSVTKRDQW